MRADAVAPPVAARKGTISCLWRREEGERKDGKAREGEKKIEKDRK